MRRGGDRILFDCGEGTQRQMQRSVGLIPVDDIFVTHLHADHYLGLPGLIKSYEMQDRAEPLVIHGPPGSSRCSSRCGGSSERRAIRSSWSS